MYQPIIDAHIHLDNYCRSNREKILHELSDFNIEGLIAVSNDLRSAKEVLKIATKFSTVKPVFGFHPEQDMPSDQELEKLITFIREHKDHMYAVGEIGLPYYLSKEQLIKTVEPYFTLLESFLALADDLDKPVVLHAIYDDGPVVCDLLERHSIKKAHFHWFKGDKQTIERMIENGYFISVTPDVLYKQNTMNLVKTYPLELMMLETDGPWPFEGPFRNKLTHPKMIHKSIEKVAEIKRLTNEEVANVIFKNTKQFYDI